MSAWSSQRRNALKRLGDCISRASKGYFRRSVVDAVALCVFLTVAAGEASEASEAKDENVVLGMSGAFSGSSSNLGAQLEQGMAAWFDHINDNGGVAGRNIVLKTYDDGYEPEPAIRNTLKLIQQDQALALIAYVGTPTVTRVLPVLSLFRDQNLLLFFPFTGAEPQRRLPYKEFAYNLRPSYRHETRGLVDRFVAVGRRRIALFYQADAYGRSGWEGVRRALLVHDLEIVVEATYRRGGSFEASYSAQVGILRQAEPDAVISIASYAAAAGFIRDARDSAWQVPIANVSFVDSESLLALLLQQLGSGGTDYTSRLVNSEVVPNYREDHLPAVREYRELMQARPSARLSFVSLEGFLNAKVMVEVLQRMGQNIDRANFRPVMSAMADYDLGIGEQVRFGPDDNQGLERVYFNRIENGRYVSLDDWSEWLRDTP